MTVIARAVRRCTVNVALAALTVAPPVALVAQSRPVRGDTLSARVRDSLIAAVLADTLDGELDALEALQPSNRQSFTVRPTYRSYKVGEIDASEYASYASWTSRFRRATLRVDFTPLAYESDTSVTADRPRVTVRGAAPVGGRLDLRLRGADTLRLFAQSASFPGTLTDAQAQALAAVGTSTIDVDA
ncbi:MAG TPA: hypothetical protein VE861_16185, partial [Gemmatimonadaceae bacterium]|nr:hypothetical protein [Gemmatimonadaceae bacterium]